MVISIPVVRVRQVLALDLLDDVDCRRRRRQKGESGQLRHRRPRRVRVRSTSDAPATLLRRQVAVAVVVHQDSGVVLQQPLQLGVDAVRSHGAGADDAAGGRREQIQARLKIALDVRVLAFTASKMQFHSLDSAPSCSSSAGCRRWP